MRPTDPLYRQQTQFDRTGDVEAIWAEHTGRGISVAVYDDGIAYDHPDLAANYDATRHFTHQGTTYDGAPVRPSAQHGTPVAGILAAAQGNDLGGVGVAWNAKLTSIPIIGDGPLDHAPLAVTLAAYHYAATFDIMSNSWGWSPSFDPQYSALNGGWMSDTIAAIEHVTQTGREGLGTLVVQAAGNDAGNANGTGIDAVRFTTVVAATDARGDKPAYANHGTNVLIAAPTAGFTTDLPGTDGYRDGDYTAFSGTSAATPFVSGVIALMLEANPSLGWRDVQTILALSAQHTGSGYGNPANGAEVGPWQDNGADIWNGGGLTFSRDYGFGLVDAFAAVRMAEAWRILHPLPATSATEQHRHVVYEGPVIPLSRETRSDISFDLNHRRPVTVEHISVNVTYTAKGNSDLTVDLVSPSGVAMRLFDGDATLDSKGKSASWSFGVTGFLGVEAAGTWSLRLDNEGSGLFTLTAADLHVYGRAGARHDVYHFTDAYPLLAARDPERRSVSETDGGQDALNLAAIADDIVVDLRDGTGHVDGLGMPLALPQADQIEIIVTGDGADMIRGGDADTAFHGMRGADSLSGGAGHDALYGGAGHDVLDGGDGHDTLVGGGRTDTLSGGPGNDSLRGGSGADHMQGGAGDDHLSGGPGNDALEGGRGHDTMRGDAGADVLTGGNGADLMRGGRGHDVLRGGGEDDTLSGERGQDSLEGGSGADVLTGGPGHDHLTGGGGADLFVFARGFGRDTITDFEVASDAIDLRAVAGIPSLTDLWARHLFARDGDVVISAPGPHQIVLQNVGLAELEADHFLI